MPLSEQMIADGWIEWSGGKCPVPADSHPDVMFANGRISGGAEASFWTRGYGKQPAPNLWDRAFSNRKKCIIAYRPETANAR